MNTDKLWRPDNYTKTPNDVLGWVVIGGTRSIVAIRVVGLILRLSCGFHGRSHTNKRLSLTEIAEIVRCDVSSAQRAVQRLLAMGRIYRFDPQGDHYYYALRDPGATQTGASAKSHSVSAKQGAIDAKLTKNVFAPTQSSRGGMEPISSLIKRVMPTGLTPNMPTT